MARDVTVTDTYAESHVSHTAREPGAAANKASSGNTAIYGALSYLTRRFHVAIKIAGTGPISHLTSTTGDRQRHRYSYWGHLKYGVLISVVIYSSRGGNAVPS